MLTRRSILTMGLVALGATAAKAQPLGQGLASQFDDHPISYNDRNLVKPQFRRQLVRYNVPGHAGKIVVDTKNFYLYQVRDDGTAIRYGVGVGREGFEWSGDAQIGRKQRWPDWHPPAEMRERQPYLPVKMDGGPGNPLGARAMYLGNTLYRIHGTHQPWTIGENISSGCIRLRNEDVISLYDMVQVGAKVIVQ